MSPGVKIIILVLCGVLAIAGIVIFIMPKSQAPAGPGGPVLINKALDNGGTQGSDGLPGNNQGKTEPPALPQASQEEKTRELIRQLALAFTERFGTFQNLGNFENITDLFPLMTDRFKLLEERQITKMSSERKPNALPVTMTTRALVVEIPEIASGVEKVQAIVKTQRQEQKDKEEKVWYQDLELKILKQGEGWKVDEAAWK